MFQGNSPRGESSTHVIGSDTHGERLLGGNAPVARGDKLVIRLRVVCGVKNVVGGSPFASQPELEIAKILLWIKSNLTIRDSSHHKVSFLS